MDCRFHFRAWPGSLRAILERSPALGLGDAFLLALPALGIARLLASVLVAREVGLVAPVFLVCHEGLLGLAVRWGTVVEGEVEKVFLSLNDDFEAGNDERIERLVPAGRDDYRKLRHARVRV